MEGFDDPGPQPNKWAGRMKWKPHGNPRLHPDEEAALAQGQPGDMPEPTDISADDLLDRPPTVAPHVSNVQPVRGGLEEPGTAVPIRQKSRFDLPKPQMEPMRFAGAADIDRLMAEIKAEEAKPPHQQNAAKIAQLKADAMELMSQEESQRVQRMADRLIPRVDEVKIYATSTKPYPGSTSREKEAPAKPKAGWQKLCRHCGKPSGTKDVCGCRD